VTRTRATFTRFVVALFLSVAAGNAAAQTLTPEEEAAQGKFVQQEEAKLRLAISGWIESGITVNPDTPRDNQNFGRFFDDRANEPLLNQVVLNFERALVPKPGEFDWGFKVQWMYGSDARFIHSLGLLDHTAAGSILQPDLVEAYLNLHFPVFSEGGVDVKFGKFVTLEGAETIDPRTNFFYSHTYIFNFGIPLNHTGALATWHATSHVNLVAGVTRGVNTSIDDRSEEHTSELQSRI